MVDGENASAGEPRQAKNIAQGYLSRGWKPIPIPFGEKGPQGKNWQSRTYDTNRDFDGLNVGVLLGPSSGGLTDVDLDCIEAIALAPHFLPKTDAIFGRKSKPKSHWLYITNDPDPDKSAIRLIDDAKKAIIELRMGGGNRATQTVFPGSTHESGEKVEWASAGEPTKSSCAILKDAITKIAVGALLARKWPEGNRHDACLRCGGFLARAGWEPDVIEDFMAVVQRGAGVTDASHVRGGCKAAVDGAIRARAGGESYGFPAMVEMFGEPVAKRLADLLQYRTIDKEATLERLNEKFCIMPFGGKVRVLAFERELNRAVMTFYSAADFCLLHANVQIPIAEDKTIGLGKWWITHPQRRQYEGLVFAPASPRVIDGRLLNLWQGWGIAPRKGCWKRLRKHIFKVLANGDKKHAKYIIKWTAWTLQHPDQRAETALVFRGGQGTGKGLWGRLLCEIFGQHGVHISSHRQLTGNFNKHLLDCAVLFADEAFWPGDKSSEGTLKRIVTENTIMIEPKFFDATMNVNRLHIVMASNMNWVVPAAIDDRRFAVFDVSAKYQNDKEYFTPLYQEMENGGGAAMLHDLLAMDLQGWHPRYDVPKTPALMDQKELSLHPEDQWWYQLLKTGLLPRHDADRPAQNNPNPMNPRRARSRGLFDAARERVPGLRFYSDHLLGKALRVRGCKACQLKASASAWEFPELKEARQAWDQRLPGAEWNDLTEWGDDDANTF